MSCFDNTVNMICPNHYLLGAVLALPELVRALLASKMLAIHIVEV